MWKVKFGSERRFCGANHQRQHPVVPPAFCQASDAAVHDRASGNPVPLPTRHNYEGKDHHVENPAAA